MDVDVGCAGILRGEVSLGLASSKVIATDTLAQHPQVIAWSSNELLTGSYDGFSTFVIRTSGETVKKFVNDWKRSQD